MGQQPTDWVDGRIYTAGSLNDANVEINAAQNIYFGDANSGNIVLTTNTSYADDVNAGNLMVSGGATLTITAGKTLRVRNTLVINGSITSTLVIGGSGGSCLTGIAGNGGNAGGTLFIYADAISGNGLVFVNGSNGTNGENATAQAGNLNPSSAGSNGSPAWYLGLPLTAAPYGLYSMITGNVVTLGSGGTAGALNSNNAVSGGKQGTAITDLHPSGLNYFFRMSSADIHASGGGGGAGGLSNSSNNGTGGGGGGGGTAFGAGGAGGNGGAQSTGVNGAGGHGGGGGGAGGIIVLLTRVNNSSTVTLQANGGNGGTGGNASDANNGVGGGGGGGGGGMIFQVGPSNFTTSVTGGTGGAKGSTGFGTNATNGVNGGAGKAKWVRI